MVMCCFSKLHQDSSPGVLPYSFEEVYIGKWEINLATLALICINGIISIIKAMNTKKFQEKKKKLSGNDLTTYIHLFLIKSFTTKSIYNLLGSWNKGNVKS